MPVEGANQSGSIRFESSQAIFVFDLVDLLKDENYVGE